MSCLQHVCCVCDARITLPAWSVHTVHCFQGVLALFSYGWNLLYSAKCLKTWESKGGPLSDFRIFGLPVKLNILSRAGITVFAFIEFRTSTIGNLEYSSISTIIYFPSGQGPVHAYLIHYIVRHFAHFQWFRFVTWYSCQARDTILACLLNEFVNVGKIHLCVLRV